MIHHLYITLCAQHPKSNLLPERILKEPNFFLFEILGAKRKENTSLNIVFNTWLVCFLFIAVLLPSTAVSGKSWAPHNHLENE